MTATTLERAPTCIIDNASVDKFAEANAVLSLHLPNRPPPLEGEASLIPIVSRVGEVVRSICPALQGLSAVDQPTRAGNMTRIVRRKEGDHRSDIVWFANATQRYPISKALHACAIGRVVCRGHAERRLDYPRTDCVHADAKACSVKRRNAGQSDNAVLARGVAGSGRPARPTQPLTTPC